MIAQLEKLPLEFSPGEAWIYSVATDVVGYLVEMVSGQSYADFVRRENPGAAGDARYRFSGAAGKRDRFTTCYMLKDGKLELFDDPQNSPWFAPPKLESGGGGLAGTARRLSALLPHAAEQGRAGRRAAAVAQDRGADDHQPSARGRGNRRSVAGRRRLQRKRLSRRRLRPGRGGDPGPGQAGIPGTAGEFAWGGMASTAFFVDPKEDMAVVFMTQVIVDTARRVRLRRDLRTLIYGAMTESHA